MVPDLHAPTIRGGAPPEVAPGALAPGVELAGRYRILELVGVGGMGVVYRARDLALDIDIALKRLHPRIAHDPAKLAFFRNEVRVARMVTHPNVCRLHDLEDTADGCFITMEHIAGEPLSARLARGPIEPAQARRILRDVASGLSAAHAAGVIHRDLKPSNVLLARGRAVVADFGIAGERHALGSGPQDVAGTRGFMAPEQATGAPLDARTDVYGLGVLAFVLATGRRPPNAAQSPSSPGAPAAELAAADLETQLAPLPADLAALIRDCLAASPDARPRDAAAIVVRLDALAPPAPGVLAPVGSPDKPASATGRARTAKPAGRWGLKRVSLLTVGVVVGAVAIFAVAGGEEPVPVATAPHIIVAAVDTTALPAGERWLGAAVQRLVADELVDAWGLDVEVATPDRASAAGDAPADAVVVASRLAPRTPSGRIRLMIAGETLEAPTPREVALAAARRIVEHHVPAPLRHPSAEDLADVGAHDAEAWRLWRRAQHEMLLLRWERASALSQEAHTRDPGFPLPVLDLTLGYDAKDVATSRNLAEAMDLMSRTPVRAMWPLVANAARQVIDGNMAGAAETIERAQRLDLTPRERMWLDLRWAMAIYFGDSPQAAAPAARLRCIAGRQARLGGDRATAIAAFERVAAGPTHYAVLAGVLDAILGGKLDDARARAAGLPADSAERASVELADEARRRVRMLAAR
ncbi:MAG TPA: serine/threonine-protein kinase [Kofleriaceae bacterium]|nr:serine/threonine-protein kinase [Kofleriaceae bacterium]